ncbi:signal transduction histidine kinase [Rarobacter incanus]|uniref:histidine kinase n=1 Tax=Rarobacter incanus TaxID=153494 RepID=A0A542SPA7_9MICO|nr:signal transduction histidine kinase [Rarobacter incanus]
MGAPPQRRTKNGGIITLVTLAGILFSSYAVAAGPDAPMTTQRALGMVAFIAAFGAGQAMKWRKTHPGTVMAAVGAGAVILPLDPLGTLIAMVWFIPQASRPKAIAAGAFGGVVTAMAFFHDWLRPDEHKIFSYSMTTGHQTVLTGTGYIAVAVAVWAVALTIALVRRYRADAAQKEHVAAQLRGQIERQEERDLIAREMHDTVAHGLSVISLHASALEVGTSDPAAIESARAVRQLANRGLGELRSLIGSLRDSTVDGYAGAATPPSALSRIIDESRRAGIRIQDHIDIRGADALASTAASAIYRIVQESVTNAVRHAPSSPITVTVVGGPQDGITVVVASWLEKGHRSAVGASSGIMGMQERARALGGDLRAGVEHDMWVVRAGLPWRPAEVGNGGVR